jgi:hypothetical protein
MRGAGFVNVNAWLLPLGVGPFHVDVEKEDRSGYIQHAKVKQYVRSRTFSEALLSTKEVGNTSRDLSSGAQYDRDFI